MRTIFLLVSGLVLLVGNTLFAAPDLKNAPADSIYDPGQMLDSDFRIDISNRIDYERTHRQFEVFILLFEEEPSQGARILAKQAGESWAQGEYWSVIYQVGKDAEPNCLVGGDHMAQLNSELVERRLRGSLNTALLVSTPQNRLEELVTNLTDSFGFLRIQAEEKYKEAVEDYDKKRVASKKRKEKFRALGVIAAVVLLGLAFVGYKFWRKHLRKRKPMLFPPTSPRRRLAAPYSGGGDVLVSYGRRR